MRTQIKISINEHSISSVSLIADKWRTLELKAKTHFFLSWHWVGTWLQRLDQPFYLVEAKNHEQQIVGLGILIPQRINTLRPQLWLNRTGIPSNDQTWIEYNDFLLDNKYKNDTKEALINYLLKQNQIKWQELYIGVGITKELRQYQQKNLRLRNISISKSYYADLSINTTDYEEFLNRFSRNTRHQIKRSIRLIEAEGTLSLDIANDLHSKLACFNSMSSWHIEQWGNTKEGSGFTNSSFTDFHHNLIKNPDNSDCIELLSLKLNGKAVAYVYNFIDKENIYFYMSSIKRHENKKIKIGLIFHSMLMHHYACQGKKRYDFLAGDAQYKRSLATQQFDMSFSCFYKPTVLSSLENLLRKLKLKINLAFKKQSK